MSLFGELKRRNVFRVAIAYIVTAWLLLQVADVVLGNIEAPAWVFKVILLLIGLGLPLAVLFAWVFELTPDGIRKERDVDPAESVTQGTGRKLDFAIIGVLALALAYFAIDKFMLSPVAPEETARAETAGTALEDSSIAVLPFVNMSSDPEQDYFSDGISEEILNVLAQYDDLRVAARTSSFQFKGQNQDIGRIARLLNVAYVLEGSVRKSGDRLRITAQLIKADDGFHLWSETYDRELNDVFAIQDEIANAISDELSVKLALGDNGARPAVIHAANSQAYDAFLRGRAHIHQRGRASLEAAVDELEKSLRLDASFAPAHANLAIAYALLLDSPATYGDLTLAESQARAVPHAERALELQPDLAAGFAARAILALNRGDAAATIENAGKAIEINPSNGDVYTWMSIAYADLAEFEEADRVAERVLEVDPMSVIGRMNVASRLLARYRLEESGVHADALLEVNAWAGYRAHARIASFRGDTSEAIRFGLLAYRENPTDALSNQDLVFALLDVDLPAEARRISDRYAHWIDYREGHNERAIAHTERRLELDPDNREALQEAAGLQYFARNYDQARELYERLLERDRQLGTSSAPNILLALADLRRRAGDQLGAEAVVDMAVDWVEKISVLGGDSMWRHMGEGYRLAYYRDNEAAIERFRFAVHERGMRDIDAFDMPLLDDIRPDPALQALLSELEVLRAGERAETLRLICFDNPVPDAWQPLPETCDDLPQQAAARHLPRAD